MARLREALQAVIDTEGDGWLLSGHFVVVMGIERLTSAGTVQTGSWYFHPPEQPDWMTGGLLEAGLEMRADADVED